MCERPLWFDKTFFLGYCCNLGIANEHEKIMAVFFRPLQNDHIPLSSVGFNENLSDLDILAGIHNDPPIIVVPFPIRIFLHYNFKNTFQGPKKSGEQKKVGFPAPVIEIRDLQRAFSTCNLRFAGHESPDTRRPIVNFPCQSGRITGKLGCHSITDMTSGVPPGAAKKSVQEWA
jgi:hypothetical protein